MDDEPPMALERVMGLTSQHNSALSCHAYSGEVAYAAGCVVVLYHPKRNRQTRYFRAAKPIASLAFSQCGKFLAVGERGTEPAAIVWELKTGQVRAEMKGHVHGVGCLAFSSDSCLLVTVGFRKDRSLLLWDWRRCGNRKLQPPVLPLLLGRGKLSQRVYAVKFSPDGGSFVTCGEKHVKFWDASQAEVRASSPIGESSGSAGPEQAYPQQQPKPPLPPPPPQRATTVSSSHEGGAEQLAMPPQPPLPPPPPTSKSRSEMPNSPHDLCGRMASIVESQRGATFFDLACTGAKVYAITTGGLLCAFNAVTASIESFVSLEAPTAYALAVQNIGSGHEGALLAVGCSNGLVRLFEAASLRYIITLPLPPAVGHLNVSSVQELTKLTENSEWLGFYQRQAEVDTKNTCGHPFDFIESAGRVGSDATGLEVSVEAYQLRYPACLALSWLCKPPTTTTAAPFHLPAKHSVSAPPPPHLPAANKLSNLSTQLVAIYGDRSFFVWDISVLPQPAAMTSCSTSIPQHSEAVVVPVQPPPLPTVVVGKYRSFMNHAACIWDVQTIPSSLTSRKRPGDSTMATEAGGCNKATFVTCAADNTVRIWRLDSPSSPTLNRRSSSPQDSSTKPSHPSRNFFSREMVHALVTDARDLERHNTDKGRARTVADSLDISHKMDSAQIGDVGSCNMGGSVVVASLPDLETPCKVENKESPRALAVSPDGTELACGDGIGNIRVWKILCRTETEGCLYRMLYAAAAHDAEILSLAYACAPGEANPSARNDRDGVVLLLASASRDCLIHILGARAHAPQETCGDYKLLQTLEHHPSGVAAVRFSSDGQRLFSCGGDGTLALSRIQNGRQQICSHLSSVLGVDTGYNGLIFRKYREISLAPGTAHDIATEATGKYILTAGRDGQLHIHAAASGKHVRCYSADTHLAGAMRQGPNISKGTSARTELYKLAICPAGIYTAACSFDTWIRLFDFYSGKCIAQVAGHAELVTGLRFTLDGKRLISVGGDGCIFVWKLNTSITTAISDRLQELESQRERHSGVSPPLRQDHLSHSPLDTDSMPLVQIDQNSPPTLPGLQAKKAGGLEGVEENCSTDDVAECTLIAQTLTGGDLPMKTASDIGVQSIIATIEDLDDGELLDQSVHPSLLDDSILNDASDESNQEPSTNIDSNLASVVLASSAAESQVVLSIEDTDRVQMAESPRHSAGEGARGLISQDITWAEHLVKDDAPNDTSNGGVGFSRGVLATSDDGGDATTLEPSFGRIAVTDAHERAKKDDDRCARLPNDGLGDEVRRAWYVTDVTDASGNLEKNDVALNALLEDGGNSGTLVATSRNIDAARFSTNSLATGGACRMSFSRSFRDSRRMKRRLQGATDKQLRSPSVDGLWSSYPFERMTMQAADLSEVLETASRVTRPHVSLPACPPTKLVTAHSLDNNSLRNSISLPHQDTQDALCANSPSPPAHTTLEVTDTIGQSEIATSVRYHVASPSTVLGQGELLADLKPSPLLGNFLNAGSPGGVMPSKLQRDSAVLQGSTNRQRESQRTLSQERERLRTRSKHRDTASALQSMNEQLRSMGIIPMNVSSSSYTESLPISSPLPAAPDRITSGATFRTQKSILGGDGKLMPTCSSRAESPTSLLVLDNILFGVGKAEYAARPYDQALAMQEFAGSRASVAITMHPTHGSNEDGVPEDTLAISTGEFNSSSKDEIPPHGREPPNLHSPSSPSIPSNAPNSTESLPNASRNRLPQLSLGILPRAYDEYRGALMRLQTAASEVAKLYSELHAVNTTINKADMDSNQRDTNGCSSVVITDGGVGGRCTDHTEIDALLGEFRATLQDIGGLASTADVASRNVMSASGPELQSRLPRAFTSHAKVSDGLNSRNTTIQNSPRSLSSTVPSMGSTTGMLMSPPSRTAPPPPYHTRRDDSLASSVADVDMSFILERYSDMLLGMVEQKLLVSKNATG